MLVYKSCENYIVELELLSDSKTNLDRNDVVNKNYAKFRCDKAKVIKITSKYNNNVEIKQVGSDNYNPQCPYDKGLIYKVEEIVSEPKYCDDIQEVYAHGIIFF